MRQEVDILVAGGGIAGVCAALGAAESGRNVVLLEQSPFLGGNATKSNVGTICGAFYRSVAERIIPAGNAFSKSFVSELMKAHRLQQPINYHNGLYIIPYEWSLLLKFLEQRLAMWDSIKVICNGEINGVDTYADKIVAVNALLEGKSTVTFTAEAVVDCSGKSIISQLADLEDIHSDHYQAAAQIFRLKNVGETREFSLNMAIKKSMALLIRQNNWPDSFKALSVVPGSLRNERADIKLTLPDEITDNYAQDGGLSEKARQYVNQIFPILQREIASLQHAEIERIFPEPGVRVLKRSKGRYTLDEDDVLSCRRPEHGVALGVWPIEYWHTDGNVEMTYFDAEDGYLIPADCLQSQEIKNLYFAGKNISASDRAIASARVIGTCIQTGYAAGKLASCKNELARIKMTKILNAELKEADREYI